MQTAVNPCRLLWRTRSVGRGPLISISRIPTFSSKALGLGKMGYETEAIMGRKHLDFKTSGYDAKNTTSMTLWQASLSKTAIYPQVRLFQDNMKNWRQFGELYIVRKVSRICFWLHEHLVQPQPWSLPFCLQVILILVISWLSSTLCSHKRERPSEFPHDQVRNFFIVQGFPLLTASLTSQQERFITASVQVGARSVLAIDLGTTYSGIS